MLRRSMTNNDFVASNIVQGLTRLDVDDVRIKTVRTDGSNACFKLFVRELYTIPLGR